MIVDCGHDAQPNGCSTGYGADAEGKRYCYACCAEQDRAEILSDTRAPYAAYVTKAGLTNWPGSALPFRIVRRTDYQAKRWSPFSGRDRTSIIAVDERGRKWRGRNGGDGCLIIMRPAW